MSLYTIVYYVKLTCSWKKAARNSAKTVGKDGECESRGLHCVCKGGEGRTKTALRNCTPLAQGTIEPSINNGFSTWSCKRPQLDLDSRLTGSWLRPHPLIGELSIILVPRPHPHEEKKCSGYNLTSHSTPEGHNQMQSEKSEKWLYNGRYV